MKSAWDCGRTRLATEAGIQPFGREGENTPNLVPLGQRELGVPIPGRRLACWDVPAWVTR